MKEIKMLIAMYKRLPQYVLEAVAKVQKARDVHFIEAIASVGEAIDIVGLLPQGIQKRKIAYKTRDTFKSTRPRPKGFGGNVRPKNVADIRIRIEKTTGEKQHRYMAAAELLTHKDKWIKGADLVKSGICTGYLRNVRKLNSYLPAGMIVRTARGKGFMVQSLEEALS